MAYTQQFGRPNVESSAINYLTDKDKKKTTVKTEVQENAINDKGLAGTMKTQTTTDITSGRSSVSGNLPKKTYAQLEAEGGNVAAAKAYNASKNTSSTVVNTKNRFTPNAAPIKPYSIETKALEIKAPAPEPLGVKANIPKYYHHSGSNAPNMKFGGHTTTSNTTSPIGDFQASYTDSPSKTISGKSNTTSSMPFTQAQNVAMFAGFPMGQSKPPSDEVANAFVNKKRKKVLARANNQYNKRYNK
jgi:hypothetical protein